MDMLVGTWHKHTGLAHIYHRCPETARHVGAGIIEAGMIGAGMLIGAGMIEAGMIGAGASELASLELASDLASSRLLPPSSLPVDTKLAAPTAARSLPFENIFFLYFAAHNSLRKFLTKRCGCISRIFSFTEKRENQLGSA